MACVSRNAVKKLQVADEAIPRPSRVCPFAYTNHPRS
jgi:hypothetical protein